jgi:endonuclease III
MAPRPDRIRPFIKKLKELVHGKAEPLLYKLAEEYNRDPFIILIGCLLSLRTRDTVTYPVCKKLFAQVHTPEQLATADPHKIDRIIHSVNFHHKKAHVIIKVAQELLRRFNGRVPTSEEELLSLPGVGRKTANLVRAEAFGIPALGVDTHVHRLANQLGLVSTETPEATERELKKIIPRSDWIELHRLLVMCGQNRCDIGPLLHVLYGTDLK